MHFGRKKTVRQTIHFSAFCTEISVHVKILHGVPGWGTTRITTRMTTDNQP
jgi:hypothetical protein